MNEILTKNTTFGGQQSSAASRQSVLRRLADIPVQTDRDSWRKSIGGKAFFLAELLQAGIPVPPGIVLQNCPTNEAEWHKVIEWWESEDHPNVAVRSSAADEDSDNLSFAGQHKTFLNVSTAENIIVSVKKCFESLYHANSIAYRERFRDSTFFESDAAISMNVLIQKMVNPSVAGVYFTVDPMKPEAGWLIEWVDGLGESLVSGQRTPQRIHIDTVNKSEIAQTLLPTITRVESLLDFPVDIEWAIDHDGFAWVLQARPVTAQSSGVKASKAIDREVMRLGKRNRSGACWDGQTFAEWSGVPTELGFSIWAKAFGGQGALARALHTLGYCGSGRRQKFIGSTLDRVLGKPYVNLRRMDELLLGKTPFTTEPLPRPHLKFQWERMDFESLFQVPMAAIHMTRAAYRMTLSRKTWIRECRDSYTLEVERFQLPNDPASYQTMGFSDLISKFDTLARDFSERLLVWPMTLILLIESSTQNLRQLIAKSVPPDQVDAFLQRNMGHTLNSLTLEMDHLYETACADPCSRPLYLTQFGHRGAGELELSRPRWVELGERAFTMSRITLPETGNTPTVPRKPASSDSEDLQRIAKFYRPIYLQEWSCLREMLALREQWKNFVMRPYSHLRWMALEIGCRTGLEHLVFELTAAELHTLTDGPRRVSRLKRLAELRSERHQDFKDVHLPSVVRLKELKSLSRSSELVGGDTPRVLHGQALSPGLVCGEVRVVRNPEEISVTDWPEDTILVAEATDPGWTPLFLRVKGIVIEKGGALSHCAIVAREMGVPAVSGILNCCNQLKDGQKVWVDGNHGCVQLP